MACFCRQIQVPQLGRARANMLVPLQRPHSPYHRGYEAKAAADCPLHLKLSSIRLISCVYISEWLTLDSGDHLQVLLS
jgi:hypothetical protein